MFLSESGSPHTASPARCSLQRLRRVMFSNAFNRTALLEETFVSTLVVAEGSNGAPLSRSPSTPSLSLSPGAPLPDATGCSELCRVARRVTWGGETYVRPDSLGGLRELALVPSSRRALCVAERVARPWLQRAAARGA
jgi:hypothetical protein